MFLHGYASTVSICLLAGDTCTRPACQIDVSGGGADWLTPCAAVCYACRRVRTTDSVPPVIHSLTATFTPPMTFTITANTSEPGRLLYAPRKVGSPAPTVQEVLSAWESKDPLLANFTGVMDVPAALTAVVGSTCVADGDQLVVYAVAQDREGLWPGRSNNTSPVSR